MGRDHLRRGYSLEVIFEEDSDFCSLLDSLDVVPNSPLPTIQIYKSDRNTNNNSTTIFRQDAFSVETIFGLDSSTTTSAQIEPNFQSKSQDNSLNHFHSLDKESLDVKDMDTCYIEWDEFSPDSLNTKLYVEEDEVDSAMSGNHGIFRKPMLEIPNYDFAITPVIQSDSESYSTLSGRRSRVSRRQIVEANWIIDDEDDGGGGGRNMNKEATNGTNQHNNNITNNNNLNNYSSNSKTQLPLPNTRMSEQALLLTATTTTNSDNLNSSINVEMTKKNNKTNYTFRTHLAQENNSLSDSGKENEAQSGSGAGSPNEICDLNSKYSRNLSDELSCSSGSSRPTSSASTSSTAPIQIPIIDINGNTTMTVVKKVRALFECNGSEDEANSGTKTTKPKFKKTNARFGRSSETLNLSNNKKNPHHPEPIRSAYSQLNLNQMERYDLADLLVNDNIIIEDSSDSYRTFRQARNRNDSTSSSHGIFDVKLNSTSLHSNLRRSKSVGTGIHNLINFEEGTEEEEETTVDQKSENMNLSSCSSTSTSSGKSASILAEEMPARNTVKNVRSVFEQMFQLSNSSSKPNNPIGTGIPSNNRKTLTYIKSNPTSKIFRSESMRDVVGGIGEGESRFGKPILLKSNSVDIRSTTPTAITSVKKNGDVKSKENTRIRQCLNNEGTEQHYEAVEDRNEDFFIPRNAVVQNQNDEEEPRIISPDVLNRIRSLGTSTTYFGGEIVAKTVKNQKCAVVPLKKKETDEEVFDSQPIEFNSNEIYFSSKPDHGTTKQQRSSPHNSLGSRQFHLSLESIYHSRQSGRDTAPRIISVLPKSPSNSPTKSTSPAGSIIEGRNSPEGCESVTYNHSSTEQWIDASVEEMLKKKMAEEQEEANSKKFSESVGAWF